jgi:hypothetical protein
MNMKKTIFGIALITILASVLMMTGCIRVNMSEKNGPVITRSYDYTGFTGIDVGSALSVEVTPASTYSVAITAGEKVLDHVRVSLADNILKINMEGWSVDWWFGRGMPKIKITMPVLEQINLSGSSDGTAMGFKSDKDFTVKVSGASDLETDMETGHFTAVVSGASNVKGRLTAAGSDIELSGASDIDLTGSGGDIKLHASGASSIALLYYKVNNADVDFSGASDGSLDISGRLDIKLSGASDLKYAGNPTLGNIDKSDASTLKRLD